MKNSKDFDYIKEKFDSDHLSAPEDLDENAVMDLLESKPQKKIRFYNKKVFRRAVAAVACVVVVVTVLTVTRPFSLNNKVVNTPKTETVQTELNTFSDVEEIKNAVKEIEKHTSVYNYNSNEIKDAAVAETVSDTDTGDISYADTYKQVENVDEGDILKNNGKYIFYVDSSSNAVKVYSAAGQNTKLVFTFDEFEVNDNAGEYVCDIYVSGNKLIINTVRGVYENEVYRDMTVTYIYDISDIENPQEINCFSQSGYYTSSRRIDGRLYVISNQYIDSSLCKSDSDYLPYECSGNDAESQPVKMENICYTGDSDSSSYLIVSAIDTETGVKSSDTKALFGASSNIYCNENNMYAAMNEVEWKDYGENTQLVDAAVRIVKIELKGNNIEFTAASEVTGSINDQFSMDEKDGNLRVATTSYDENGEQINNLFVLDGNLKKIGEVTGFAKTESIRAVRFIGDMAYVITYEEIDPLIVIDVSVPANPLIKGEVKITGFSSLLVPVDESTLLGIGYSTEGNGNTQSADGMKLALFDISDPEKPAVLDSYTMKDTSSDAQYNHRALTVNEADGYYAIPFNSYAYDTEYAGNGALVFEVSSGKINVTDKFNVNTDTSEDSYTGIYVSRCTYIGDILYVLDDSGNISAFAINE